MKTLLKSVIMKAKFNGRMGKSDNRAMHFNLQDLFGMGMSWDLREPLEAPF
jgi:hypothetical protein